MNVSNQRAAGAFTARPAAARPQASRPQDPAQPAPKGAPRGDKPMPMDGGTDRTSALARLDGFADAITERLSMAKESLGGDDAGQLQEASELLQQGLDRLRNGFADGSLDPAAVERGVGNLFGTVAEVMGKGKEPTRPTSGAASTDNAQAVPDQAEAGDVDLAEATRDRMQTLVDRVVNRAEAAGYPDAERAAAAEQATALFTQATERLESAVFDVNSGNPIDRAGLTDLFQASFSALQGQIQSLLGGDQGQGPSPATTYGPGASAEAMSTPRGRVDFEG